MYLALTDLFRAKWSKQVQSEWVAALLGNRPDLDQERLERTCRLMNEHVRDALVSSYSNIVAGLQLPDPTDRHVLAAAIKAHADVIVTFNLKDFPADVLSPYGMEAQHPDEFVCHLLDLAPGAVATAASEHRQSLSHPKKDVAAYLATLEQQGLTQTVSGLRQYMRVL